MTAAATMQGIRVQITSGSTSEDGSFPVGKSLYRNTVNDSFSRKRKEEKLYLLISDQSYPSRAIDMNDYAVFFFFLVPAQIETEATEVHYSHSYLLMSQYSGVEGKFFRE